MFGRGTKGHLIKHTQQHRQKTPQNCKSTNIRLLKKTTKKTINHSAERPMNSPAINFAKTSHRRGSIWQLSKSTLQSISRKTNDHSAAELQKNIKALSDGKLEHSFNLQAFIILLASAYLFPGVHLASSAEEFRKIENYSLRKEI